MANNPYVNKVEYAGQTLMDLTGDTATPSDVLSGATFHDRSGAPQQGSLITHNVYDGLDSTSTSDALSANQGKALNDKIGNLIFIENKTVSNASILAGESGRTLDVTKTGYKFRGIIGWALYGVSSCVLSRAIIESNNVLTYNIYNYSGSSQTATIVFTCLYIKA